MSDRTSRTIGGIDMCDTAVVSKGHPTERDMYGGAVHLQIKWDDGGASGSASLDLDGQGVQQLISALQDVLAESAVDYESSRDLLKAIAPERKP